MANVQRLPTEYSRCIDEYFTNFQALFDEAESAIKIAEIEAGNLPIPPINELRYAGRHFIDAIAAQHNRDQINFKDQIERAMRHCQRAAYDAYEMPVFDYLAIIKKYFNSYDIEIINLFLENPPRKRAQIREIENQLASINRDRGEENLDGKEDPNDKRHIYSEWCKKSYAALKGIAQEFEDVESDMFRKAKSLNLKNVIKNVLALLGGVASIVAIITFVVWAVKELYSYA